MWVRGGCSCGTSGGARSPACGACGSEAASRRRRRRRAGRRWGGLGAVSQQLGSSHRQLGMREGCRREPGTRASGCRAPHLHGHATGGAGAHGAHSADHRAGQAGREGHNEGARSRGAALGRLQPGGRCDLGCASTMRDDRGAIGAYGPDGTRWQPMSCRHTEGRSASSRHYGCPALVPQANDRHCSAPQAPQRAALGSRSVGAAPRPGKSLNKPASERSWPRRAPFKARQWRRRRRRRRLRPPAPAPAPRRRRRPRCRSCPRPLAPCCPTCSFRSWCRRRGRPTTPSCLPAPPSSPAPATARARCWAATAGSCRVRRAAAAWWAGRAV